MLSLQVAEDFCLRRNCDVLYVRGFPVGESSDFLLSGSWSGVGDRGVGKRCRRVEHVCSEELSRRASFGGDETVLIRCQGLMSSLLRGESGVERDTTGEACTDTH